MGRCVFGLSLAAVCLVSGCAILGTGDASRTRVAVYLGRGARNCGAFCHLRMATFAENVDGFPVDEAATVRLCAVCQHVIPDFATLSIF